jgi:hypothetical protein
MALKREGFLKSYVKGVLILGGVLFFISTLAAFVRGFEHVGALTLVVRLLMALGVSLSMAAVMIGCVLMLPLFFRRKS